MAHGGELAENYGTNPPHRLDAKSPKSLILSYGTYPASLLGEIWNQAWTAIGQKLEHWNREEQRILPILLYEAGGQGEESGPKK